MACRVRAVADTDNNRLVVFSVTVAQLAAILGPVRLVLPGARIHGSGGWHAAARTRPHHRVSRRIVSGTQEGAFLRVLRTAVPFEEPDACAIIGNGAIVVAEFVGRRVQLLSRSGRLLQVFTGHTSR